MFKIALSTNALGFGSEYLSSISFSKLPALTPIRIEQLLFYAALITSFTFSSDPILPGLIRKHAAPFSAASKARL